MVLHDEIAETAYELFETRGRVTGWDLDDWLNAEQIVFGRHAGQELEEPEEELGLAAFAVVGEGKVPYEESDEPMNEEMS